MQLLNALVATKYIDEYAVEQYEVCGGRPAWT